MVLRRVHNRTIKGDNVIWYVCTGRGPGTQETCDFTTTDEGEAMAHFEEFDHDLDEGSPRRVKGKRAAITTVESVEAYLKALQSYAPACACGESHGPIGSVEEEEELSMRLDHGPTDKAT
jgi:hypothetical protein